MNTSQTHLSFSPKGMAKFIRHAGAVYPLEAYGFLIGEPETNQIVSVLPVSKTKRWYEYGDRFALLENALPVAKDVAGSFRLDVLGVYHSYFDYDCASPIHDVPEGFRSGIVCIKSVAGGELDLWPYEFYIGGIEVKATKMVRSISPDRNPRRIHSSWISRWGLIDYDNGYQDYLAQGGT